MSAPAPALEEHDGYQTADLECDVVMKGGVTSGIVYPRAICRLAQRFRLRNVGGTSAGAIAAALAAAAEVGRADPEAGFKRLAALPDRLGAPTDRGRPLLAALFQPSPRTRVVHDLMGALTRPGSAAGKVSRVAWTLVRRGGWRVMLGATPALLALAWTLLRDLQPTALTWPGLALALGVGTVAGGAWWLLYVVTRVLPRQMFGVCSGRTAPGHATPGLTDWLHGEIQKTAALPDDRPLTFADLREHGVGLDVVTTCLTHGRPYGFPGLRRTLYFDPDEFGQLFPAAVVAHLVRAGQGIVDDDRHRPERALEHAFMLPRLPLPRHDDLPVLVATRMSLSFPVLLAAVPLWDYDWGGDGTRDRSENQERRDAWLAWIDAHPDTWPRALDGASARPDGAPPPLIPERLWFSDGGISSNFPLHLFDAPLPTRPTVAIDLRYHPAGQRLSIERRVQLAQDNADRIEEDWTRLAPPGTAGGGGIVAFLARILGSMQNWTDTTLTKVPGFRDRFASVHLQSDEGGLNLEMDGATIDKLASFGERAGELLRARFEKVDGSGSELTWTNHRWTRMRTTLAVFEEWLEAFVKGLDAEEVPSYEELIERGRNDPPGSYRLLATQRDLFLEVIERLRETRADIDAAERGLTHRAPRPTPALRVMPRLHEPAE